MAYLPTLKNIETFPETRHLFFLALLALQTNTKQTLPQHVYILPVSFMTFCLW